MDHPTPPRPGPHSSDDYQPDDDLPPSDDNSYATPQSNISHHTQVSARAKKHLKKVSEGGDCCILTQEIGQAVCCHVLRRAVGRKNPMITQLEKAWGMKPNSLCLDTTRNMLFLRPDHHQAFDADNWALMPSQEVVQDIFKRTIDTQSTYKREHFLEMFPHKQWTYEMCHFQGPPTRIYRFSRPTQVAPNLPDHTRIDHPFEDFRIESHVHPYFVIWNVATKYRRFLLNHKEPNMLDKFRERAALCLTILKLWESFDIQNATTLRFADQPGPPSRRTRSRTHSDHTSRNSNDGRRGRNDPNAPADTHNPGSAKRPRGMSSSASARSLPTPGASQSRGRDHAELCALHLATTKDLLVRRPPSVEHWIKVAGSDDPTACSTAVGDCEAIAQAEIELKKYAGEESRKPPAMPWQEWQPGWRDVVIE